MTVKRLLLVVSVFAVFISAPLFSKERVAVLDFSAKDVAESDALAVADLFRSDLVAAGNYTVLERGNMRAILSEHELQMKGLVNESSASEIGELLAVNYLFNGNLSKFGNNFILVIDKISVQTGEIEKSVKKTAVNINAFLDLSAEAAAELSGDTSSLPEETDSIYTAETLTQLMNQITIFNLFELSQLEINQKEMQTTDLALRRSIYDDFALSNSTLCMIVNAVTFGIGGNFMQGFDEYGYLSIATTAGLGLSILSGSTPAIVITGILYAASYIGSYVVPFMYEAEYNQYLKDSLLVY